MGAVETRTDATKIKKIGSDYEDYSIKLQELITLCPPAIYHGVKVRVLNTLVKQLKSHFSCCAGSLLSYLRKKQKFEFQYLISSTMKAQVTDDIIRRIHISARGEIVKPSSILYSLSKFAEENRGEEKEGTLHQYILENTKEGQATSQTSESNNKERLTLVTDPKAIAALKGTEVYGAFRDPRTVFDSNVIDEKLKKELEKCNSPASKTRRTPKWSRSKLRVQSMTMTFADGFGEKTFKCGWAKSQGGRDHDEDRFVVEVLEVECEDEMWNIPLLCVFDGHRGSKSSEFLQEETPKYLKQRLGDVLLSPPEKRKDMIWNQLKTVFVDLHNIYCEKYPNENSAGSTALCALILGNEIWVANAGDSRAILVRGKRHVQLSDDAKASSEQFQKAVYNRGGEIKETGSKHTLRVNGHLIPTRAVGDVGVGPGITARSKVVKVPLPSDNFTLVLASDGLWDVAESFDVAADIRKWKASEPQEQAKWLMRKARLAGSTDNMTILVLRREQQ